MVKYYIKVVNHETYYFREQHEKIVYYIVKRHQLEAVASLRRAVRPGCHYFGLTPFYDTFQGKKNLILLEMFSTLEWTKKLFKASFETFT